MPPLNYLERLCIAWFLWWRILRTSFFVNLGLGVILGWWGTAIGLQHETIVGIGYVLGFAFTMMLVSPWVLGMLPYNQFSGFRVGIVDKGWTDLTGPATSRPHGATSPNGARSIGETRGPRSWKRTYKWLGGRYGG